MNGNLPMNGLLNQPMIRNQPTNWLLNQQMNENQPMNGLLNQSMNENQPFTFSHHHQLCWVRGWTLSSIAKWKLRPITSNLSYRGVPWTIENSVGSMIHHATQGSQFHWFRNSLQLFGLDQTISQFYKPHGNFINFSFKH